MSWGDLSAMNTGVQSEVKRLLEERIAAEVRAEAKKQQEFQNKRLLQGDARAQQQLDATLEGNKFSRERQVRMDSDAADQAGLNNALRLNEAIPAGTQMPADAPEAKRMGGYLRTALAPDPERQAMGGMFEGPMQTGETPENAQVGGVIKTPSSAQDEKLRDDRLQRDQLTRQGERDEEMARHNREVEARMAGAANGADISPEDVSGVAEMVLNGRMAPSQINLAGGMGQRGSKFKQAVVAQINQRNPNFNWQSAEAGYKFGSNPGVQNTVRFLDNIEKTLPVLEAASSAMKRGNVRLINKASLEAQSQLGNVDVAKFEFARTILADEIAKILQGGGTGSGTSDAKLRQANELLASDLSPDQLAGVIASARELLSTRRDALTTGTFLSQGGNNGDGETKQGATGGMVTMIDPIKGRTLNVPADKVAEFEALGAKRK